MWVCFYGCVCLRMGAVSGQNSMYACADAQAAAVMVVCVSQLVLMNLHALMLIVEVRSDCSNDVVFYSKLIPGPTGRVMNDACVPEKVRTCSFRSQEVKLLNLGQKP